MRQQGPVDPASVTASPSPLIGNPLSQARLPAPSIVVFRPGALGDTILTIDALAALRARWPDEPIELVGNPSAGALLVDAGLIDRSTPFDSGDVTGLYTEQPTVPARWAGVQLAVLWLPAAEPVRSALLGAGASQVLWATPSPPPGMHAADHLVASLASLGLHSNCEMRVLIDQSRAVGNPANDNRTAIVHPGSGAPAKNWPAEHFAAVIRWLTDAGWAVCLLRGPADASPVSTLGRLLGGEAPPTAEPIDTRALAVTLRRAGLYVGNDSGVSHVSARLGVPSVAVFGPTDPQQWAPRGPRTIVCAGDPWPTETDVRDAVRRVLQSLSREPAS